MERALALPAASPSLRQENRARGGCEVEKATTFKRSTDRDRGRWVCFSDGIDDFTDVDASLDGVAICVDVEELGLP